MVLFMNSDSEAGRAPVYKQAVALHVGQHAAQGQPVVAVHVPQRHRPPPGAAARPLLQLPLRWGRRLAWCSSIATSASNQRSGRTLHISAHAL